MKHNKGEIHCVEVSIKGRMCFVKSCFHNGEGDIVFCGVDFIDIGVLRGKALICAGSFGDDVCNRAKDGGKLRRNWRCRGF